MLQRRAALNPDVVPLPRLQFKRDEDKEDKGIGPDTHFLKEVVTDGIDRGMQSKHTSRGKPFRGSRYYFTRGAVPGLVLSGTPRIAGFDQVVLDVPLKLEDVIQAFLSVCPALRHAVRKEAVKKIITNFFPVSIPEESGSRAGTSIFVKQSMASYPLQNNVDVVLYPATLAYNKEEGSIKCWMDAAPLTADHILLRPFQEGLDNALALPESEMAQLLEVFQAKRGTNIAASDAIFAE